MTAADANNSNGKQQTAAKYFGCKTLFHTLHFTHQKAGPSFRHFSGEAMSSGDEDDGGGGAASSSAAAAAGATRPKKADRKKATRYVDINQWESCESCGVTGPDVRYSSSSSSSRHQRSCAHCSGKALPTDKYKGVTESYWNARRTYHECMTELASAQAAIEEAKEVARDAQDDVDEAAKELVAEEEKLSNGEVWGIDYTKEKKQKKQKEAQKEKRKRKKQDKEEGDEEEEDHDDAAQA